MKQSPSRFLFIQMFFHLCLANISQISCSFGSYKVDKEPFGKCAGYRECELGFYCQEGERYKCPAGTFGAATGLTTSICSGACPPGYYCPKGSVSGTEHPCGGADVYCLEGSVAPIQAPSGFYTVGGPENGQARERIKVCEKGTFCEGGMRKECPGGTYGDQEGLTTEACTALCPEGYYCPSGTGSGFSHRCNQVHSYCPLGSERPLAVARGYYTVAWFDLEEGHLYYAQQLCEPGYFCMNGVRSACPAGRYGAAQGETHPLCTGVCDPGYFCKEASFRPDQEACGNHSVYCPEGSSAPTVVLPGYYTYGDGGLEEEDPWSRTHMRVGQNLCDKGFYCADGVRHICPPGFYGDQEGMSDPGCSGSCPAGFYCPAGSTDPYENECGAPNLFCPEGSASPQGVGVGFFTVGSENKTTRTSERRCVPGTFCHEGEVHQCFAGFYGDEFGLTHGNCSGLCAPGYFCPNGSEIATQVQCGDPFLYCPEGSPAPIEVDEGYYTVGGDNASVHWAQEIAKPGQFALKGLVYTCPAGVYGATFGLSDAHCSGLCQEGFFCPPGSTSRVQVACGGPQLYCPRGSPYPLPVTTGYYTSVTREEMCPPGYFRNHTGVVDDTRLHPSAISTVVPQAPCDLCPEGTYKAMEGDSEGLCLPCDEWTSTSVEGRRTCSCHRLAGGQPYTALYFNTTTGVCQNVSVDFNPPEEKDITTSIYTRFEQMECEEGYYCIQGIRSPCAPGTYGSERLETNPACSGLCAPGYYCLEASPSITQHPCGSSDLYCPEGSFTPTFVSEGYYTNEDAPVTFRSYQIICPPGYYCQKGLRFKCPAGSYGASEGLFDAQCSGICDRGHYCPAASIHAKEHECGGPGVYCPPGSAHPTPVDVGFYTIHTGVDQARQAYWDQDNTTKSAQLLCEPGHYCSGGIKQPCPEGVYGWEYGLTNSSCSGPCSEGHHCPMGSVKADEKTCGTSYQFCPEGTGEIVHNVRAGYYTVGGDERKNNTRISETKCEPGFYCKNGIKTRCPPGTFGNQYGLKSDMCSGFCPAGFYCPIGTAEPLACEDGMYSTAAAYECIKCPGVLGSGQSANVLSQRCRDSRKCCSY